MPSPLPAPATIDPAWVAEEIAHCACDPVYFIRTYCTIVIRRPDGAGTVAPFDLWDYQTRLVTALSRGGHYMILKARQLGITTTIDAYGLWKALFFPHAYILFLSKRDKESKDLLARLLTTYDALPAWMRKVVSVGPTRNSEIVTFSNGSTVQSMAATEGAGRSSTASLVFIDEADFLPNLEETYRAVKPTVDGGGQLVLASTSNGPLTFFAKLWEMGATAEGDLRCVFFPWHVRPDRDAAWFESKKATSTGNALRREYPATPQDAFSSAASLVYPEYFAPTHMERLTYRTRGPEDERIRVVETRRYGRFTIVAAMAAQDWNIASPGAALVGLRADDGTILVVDGWYEAGLPAVSEDPTQLTWRKIHAQFVKTYGVTKIWCDHSPENIAGLTGAGLPAHKAIKDVVSGINRVAGLLAIRQDNQRPGILFDLKLEFLSHEFYSYRHRQAHGLILDDVVKENDHAMDALRYLVQGLCQPAPRITLL